MAFGFTMQALIELIRQHGVLAVMAGAMIEEIIVPIPSPIIPMAAGSLLIETNQLVPAMVQVFLYITIPASVASVLSSYFVYAIAYFGGKPVIEKYGRWLDLDWEEMQRFEAHFGHDKEKYYVAGFRAVPIVPLSMVSGAAGLFRMDWKEYGVWSFVGMLPRNFGLAMIGWYFKDSFLKWAQQIDQLSTLITVGIIAVVVLFLIDRKLGGLYKYALRS